jgi:hypothetical protein
MKINVKKGSVDWLLEAVDKIDGAYTGRTDDSGILYKDIPRHLADACRGYLGIAVKKARKS